MVPKPEGEHIIGTKWTFRNKTDEEGNVICNKTHLVAQGYLQMEGVDYDETFAPVAHMESIRILLPLACHLKLPQLRACRYTPHTQMQNPASVP